MTINLENDEEEAERERQPTSEQTRAQVCDAVAEHKSKRRVPGNTETTHKKMHIARDVLDYFFASAAAKAIRAGRRQATVENM